MGRKRRNPEEATELGIIPIHCSKRDFEERNKSIIDFTEALRARNRNLNGRELFKNEVTSQYTLTILQEYATVDPRSFELLGQVSSHFTCTFGIAGD